MSDYSPAELAALKAAYAKGVTEVSYDGRVVKYASGGDLARRIRVIEAEMAKNTAAARPVARFAGFARD